MMTVQTGYRPRPVRCESGPEPLEGRTDFEERPPRTRPVGRRNSVFALSVEDGEEVDDEQVGRHGACGPIDQLAEAIGRHSPWPIASRRNADGNRRRGKRDVDQERHNRGSARRGKMSPRHRAHDKEGGENAVTDIGATRRGSPPEHKGRGTAVPVSSGNEAAINHKRADPRNWVRRGFECSGRVKASAPAGAEPVAWSTRPGRLPRPPCSRSAPLSVRHPPSTSPPARGGRSGADAPQCKRGGVVQARPRDDPASGTRAERAPAPAGPRCRV